MDIKDYIKNIKSIIKKENNYDDYIHACEEYKEFLLKILEKDENNIEANCQLASISLDKDNTVNILEDLLKRCENQMSNEDKARVYTNLAYFYEEDYYDDEELIEKSIKYLKKSIELNPQMKNAYIGLGERHFEMLSPLEKEKYLSIISELHNSNHYYYNYGVSLYKEGEIEKAKEIFKELSLKEAKNEEEEYAKDKSCYAYGICLAKLKEITKAEEVAFSLLTSNIFNRDIASLYYLCGNYEKCIETYIEEEKTFDLLPTDINKYFYSLMVLGKKDELKTKFDMIIKEKNKEIFEVKLKETNEEYIKEWEEEIKKDVDEILEGYEKITKAGFKPDSDIELYLEDAYCYLIDCPRHQAE